SKWSMVIDHCFSVELFNINLIIASFPLIPPFSPSFHCLYFQLSVENSVKIDGQLVAYFHCSLR
ncbi:hypothetical protein, partial [Fischerella thermalis]|uniref:hypothetical protein n=1 Tax=Fischerella thermalis TaxID=372787 RepID=UPI001CA51E42